VTRYVAFLRAINVGGHTVKMDDLRRRFEAMGFDRVSTFIASGNVLFGSEESDAAALEQRIERALKDAFGYEVATFLRTGDEVARVAAHEPFPDVERRPDDMIYVAFMRAEPEPATRDRLLALANEVDLLHLRGPDLYWLRRGNFLESTLGGAVFERALGRAPTTVRNVNTVRRLAAKLVAEAKG
jgi:uncharacterized protein (DUF1697 family)